MPGKVVFPDRWSFCRDPVCVDVGGNKEILRRGKFVFLNSVLSRRVSLFNSGSSRKVITFLMHVETCSTGLTVQSNLPYQQPILDAVFIQVVAPDT